MKNAFVVAMKLAVFHVQIRDAQTASGLKKSRTLYQERCDIPYMMQRHRRNYQVVKAIYSIAAIQVYAVRFDIVNWVRPNLAFENVQHPL
jgi:hypothetical protein